MSDKRFRTPPPAETKPKIWVDGSQRPRFDFRAFARATGAFARSGTAVILAAIAQWLRRMAVNVRDGMGRIPEARLGRLAPYVPSHRRVAMWIRNFSAIQAHASATADPDYKRGNALVAGIEAPLWPEQDPATDPQPPGQMAAMTIQVLGYGLGWAAILLLLPYGLVRAVWAYAKGQDLRKIGRDD